MDDTPFTVEARCMMPAFDGGMLTAVDFRCGVSSLDAGMAILNAIMPVAEYGVFILWQRDAGQAFYATI
jgi:hypothetical protein